MKSIFARLDEEPITPNANQFSDFLENKLNKVGLGKNVILTLH